MNILITGGIGYIGSHLEAALAATDRVIIYDNLSSCKLKKPLSESLCVVGDVRDGELLFRTLRDYKIELVIHLAAISSIGSGSLYEDVNHYGTKTVISCMQKAGVNKLIFFSSASVYGDPGFPNKVKEFYRLNPISDYGISKIRAEMEIAKSNLNYIILRPFNVVGYTSNYLINTDLSLDNHILPTIIRCAISGNMFYIRGKSHYTPDGTCIRDYVHIDDIVNVVVALVRSMDRGRMFGSIYNVGTGFGISIMDVLAAAKTCLGDKLHYQFSEPSPIEPSYLVADTTLMKLSLNHTLERVNILNIIENYFSCLK